MLTAKDAADMMKCKGPEFKKAVIEKVLKQIDMEIEKFASRGSDSVVLSGNHFFGHGNFDGFELAWLPCIAGDLKKRGFRASGDYDLTIIWDCESNVKPVKTIRQ